MNQATSTSAPPDVVGDAEAIAGTIAERLDLVRDHVAEVAREVGRRADDVTIVAVGKTWGIDRVEAAARAGHRDFGESRAQELRDKVDARDDLIWHFVGRLQTNKVKYVVGACALVHSLDRWDLAESLAARAEFEDTTQDVLVQVNADDDPAKAGVDPEELPGFLDRLETLTALRCRGLMTIPAMDGDPRSAYSRLRELRDRLRDEHPSVVHLSMGMSRDFPEAIREGATIVRVGEAIFGPRQTQR